MMGRLPYLFTRTLLMGPRKAKERRRLCVRDETEAHKRTGGLLPQASSFHSDPSPARELG